MRNNILVAGKTGTLVTTGNLKSSVHAGRWALPEGDIAFFDPSNFDILNLTDWAITPEVGVAAGYRNSENELLARLGAGDKIIGSQITNLSCSGPRCAQNEVKDFMVDCVYPGEVYTVVIDVFDERSSQRTGSVNVGIPYKFTVTAEEVDQCTDCDEGSRLEQVLCAMVNKINTGTASGETPEGIWGRDRRIERQMFRAAKLTPFATTFSVDSITSGACKDCDGVTALGSLTIGSGEDEIVIDFSSLNTDLETGSILFNEYLVDVVNMINTHATANIWATLLTNGQNCCGHTIDIMHCADNLVLTDADGAPILGTTTEPLTKTCSKVEVCHTCEEVPASPTPLPGGIRIYFDPIGYEIEKCGYVTWPLVPVSMGRIYASDRGYQGFTKWCVFDVREAIYPMNLGWQWMEYELDTDMDGIGREYSAGIGSMYNNMTNDFPKRLGLASKPNEQYYAFVIEHFNTYYDKFSTTTFRKNEMRDIILVPKENETLRTAIMEALNLYSTSIPGKKLPVLDCGIQLN